MTKQHLFSKVVSVLDSSSSSSSSSIKGASNPINVGLTLSATKGSGNDVNVNMSTHATSSGGNNQYALSSTKKSGKIDKLDVKIAVGDWAHDPGDRDDLDFLICISGAKGGRKPTTPVKNPKDIDLRLDIDLKGMPLKAVFRYADVDDLKLVKCIDKDGKPGWGYVGTVDDVRTLKLALNSPASGEKVAELSIKFDVDGSDNHG